MRAFSREAQTTYYKFQQSLPRNFTQQKRLKELHTLKDNEVKVGIYKYSTQNDLGKGYSSKVYKAVEIEKTHKRYAIKVIELKKFRGSNLEMLEAEIQIHKNLVHDNVVRLYQVIKTPYYFYIIMEYCPHGNLHQYIKQKKKLTESNAIQIMDQVLAGSKYLMEEGIIHRDLKPANILRVGNKWKISDFGFAVKSRYGFKDRINMGTPLYMSPQSLKKSYYSAKTDIFALGVILYEMIEGKTPWECKNQKELLEKIKEELIMPQHIKNPKIRQFISRCCELSQNKRMSRQELLEFELASKNQKEGRQTDKQSLLMSSLSRAADHSRRPSILNEKSSSQNVTAGVDFLYRQLLFAKHLFSCIRNLESYLLHKDNKQRLILTLFKLLLKIARFLSDKKENRFKIPNWEEVTSSKPYRQLYQVIVDEVELYEKQYLQQIKLNDIKNIRAINKRFPDLCHHNVLPPKFYEDLEYYLVDFIRQHNHQLMLLSMKQTNNYEVINTQAAALKTSNNKELSSSTKAKVEDVQIADSRTQSQRKYQIKSQVDLFPKNESISMTAIMSEPKKQSRLVTKRLSRQESKLTQNRNSKVEEEKTNKFSQRSITLQDKYQALQSLYTIYRVCQLRGGHEDEKQIAIDKIKVVQNFMDGTLQKTDYLDLRRLIRAI